MSKTTNIWQENASTCVDLLEHMLLFTIKWAVCLYEVMAFTKQRMKWISHTLIDIGWIKKRIEFITFDKKWFKCSLIWKEGGSRCSIHCEYRCTWTHAFIYHQSFVNMEYNTGSRIPYIDINKCKKLQTAVNDIWVWLILKLPVLYNVF